MINNITIDDTKVNKLTYDEAFNQVQQKINQALTKSPLIIREYTKHLSLSHGKYIRAVSVLITAQDDQGLIHPNGVIIAAAIEILHLATLVHDDIIDNADLRRGNITLQKKYGKRTAVICGDYLLSIALRMAASASDKEEYIKLDMPDYVGKVCLGELNQHINNFNINLSFYQYLKIISGKTAALFEASFYAGAILSGCSKEDVKNYQRLGFYIGMIFQLSDDCIDFDTTIEVANKPVQSDYEQGVITLPLLHAFNQQEDLKTKAQKGTLTRNEINEAVAKTGGLDFTRSIVKKYYNKSLRLLDEIHATESKKKLLMQLLNKASRL